jgi:hypothetical protein
MPRFEELETIPLSLPSGDSYRFWTCRRMRVPGGWIYTERGLAVVLQGAWWTVQTTSSTSVFVPGPDVTDE